MEAHEFNPEFTLDHADRGQLSQTLASPGWLIVEKIMRSEVSKFIIDLINAPEGNDVAVVAKHRMSKAAAQFHTGVVRRINSEIQQYAATQGKSSPPIDPTEGLVDLGEFAQPNDEEFDLDSLS
jgi:hypothetical protein